MHNSVDKNPNYKSQRNTDAHAQHRLRPLENEVLSKSFQRQIERRIVTIALAAISQFYCVHLCVSGCVYALVWWYVHLCLHFISPISKDTKNGCCGISINFGCVPPLAVRPPLSTQFCELCGEQRQR